MTPPAVAEREAKDRADAALTWLCYGLAGRVALDDGLANAIRLLTQARAYLSTDAEEVMT